MKRDVFTFTLLLLTAGFFAAWQQSLAAGFWSVTATLLLDEILNG